MKIFFIKNRIKFEQTLQKTAGFWAKPEKYGKQAAEE